MNQLKIHQLQNKLRERTISFTKKPKNFCRRILKYYCPQRKNIQKAKNTEIKTVENYRLKKIYNLLRKPQTLKICDSSSSAKQQNRQTLAISKQF